MTDRKQFRFPTPDEMIALNAAAHRARARKLRVMFRVGARAVKWRFAHLAAMSTPKRVSHA